MLGGGGEGGLLVMRSLGIAAPPEQEYGSFAEDPIASNAVYIGRYLSTCS